MRSFSSYIAMPDIVLIPKRPGALIARVARSLCLSGGLPAPRTRRTVRDGVFAPISRCALSCFNRNERRRSVLPGAEHRDRVVDAQPVGAQRTFGKLRRSREGDLPLRSLPALSLACAVLSLSAMTAVVQGRSTASTRPASFDIEVLRAGRALRPENTLQSFANALSMGVDTLELDMGVTKD